MTVIRSWLGHAHLDTTNHYAQADLKTKRVALEQVDIEVASVQTAAMEKRPGPACLVEFALNHARIMRRSCARRDCLWGLRVFSFA